MRTRVFLIVAIFFIFVFMLIAINTSSIAYQGSGGSVPGSLPPDGVDIVSDPVPPIEEGASVSEFDPEYQLIGSGPTTYVDLDQNTAENPTTGNSALSTTISSSTNNMKDYYNDFDKRLSILESAKDDLSVWIKLFLTSVTILIALNIGVSVWQVQSIAHREVANNIKQYDDEFNKLLKDSESNFDNKISSYEDRLKAILDKIASLNSKSDRRLDVTKERISQFKDEIETTIENFKNESQDIKSKILNDLEKWHSERR